MRMVTQVGALGGRSAVNGFDAEAKLWAFGRAGPRPEMQMRQVVGLIVSDARRREEN